MRTWRNEKNTHPVVGGEVTAAHVRENNTCRGRPEHTKLPAPWPLTEWVFSTSKRPIVHMLWSLPIPRIYIFVLSFFQVYTYILCILIHIWTQLSPTHIYTPSIHFNKVPFHIFLDFSYFCSRLIFVEIED